MKLDILVPVLPVAESFDSALLSEPKMLGFRESTELTRGRFDGKVEAQPGADEIHSRIVEGADASIRPCCV